MDDLITKLKAVGMHPFVIDENTIFPTPNLLVNVLILHKIDSDFWHTTVGEYELVAELAYPINDRPESIFSFLNAAFADTQHVTEAGWTANECVRQVWPPCRSSSVGDIFVINERFFIVAPFGFEEVK